MSRRLRRRYGRSETGVRWAERMARRAEREGAVTIPYPRDSAPVKALEERGFYVVASRNATWTSSAYTSLRKRSS